MHSQSSCEDFLENLARKAAFQPDTTLLALAPQTSARDTKRLQSWQQTGEELLNKPGFSTFSGHAIRCTLAMKRVSGFRKKPVMLRFWDEENTEAPEIWLGRLNNALPLVPVKFQADFNLGYMIVYLVKADYRGRSLLAAGLGKRK